MYWRLVKCWRLEGNEVICNRTWQVFVWAFSLCASGIDLRWSKACRVVWSPSIGGGTNLAKICCKFLGIIIVIWYIYSIYYNSIILIVTFYCIHFLNCPLFWNVHLSMIQTLILIGKMDISKTDTGMKSILVAGALAWGLWKLQTAPRSDMILSGWIWEVFDDSVSFLKNQASKNGPNLKHAGTSVVATRTGVFQDFPYFLMDWETSPMTFPCVWWWSKPPGPTTKIRIFSTDPLRCAASKVGWSQGREWWWVLGRGLGERLEGLELLEGLILMTLIVEPQIFLDLFDEQTSLQRFDLQVSICTWAGVTLPSTLELFSMSLGDLSSTSPSPWPGGLMFFSQKGWCPYHRGMISSHLPWKILMFWGVAHQFQERVFFWENRQDLPEGLEACHFIFGIVKAWRHVMGLINEEQRTVTWHWSVSQFLDMFLKVLMLRIRESLVPSFTKKVWEIHEIWYNHGCGKMVPPTKLFWTGPWPRVDCCTSFPQHFQDRGDFVNSAVPILAGAVPGNYDISYLEVLVEKNGVPWTQPGQHPIHKESILKLVWHSGPGTSMTMVNRLQTLRFSDAGNGRGFYPAFGFQARRPWSPDRTKNQPWEMHRRTEALYRWNKILIELPQHVLERFAIEDLEHRCFSN